uniref:Integrase domain containing protein n=1 Tax=Haemonchus contortus TaxID=6289 RepID=W6NYA7_HAECO
MLFARFGNPRVIVSDNGTQFTSKEFQEFCEKQGIEHIRSPPFHPQSNGQAKRFVDTLKRALFKSKGGEKSELLAEFLKCYRRTPCTTTPKQLSPAELFLGRQLRTTLTLLKEEIRNEKGSRKTRMERQYNLHHGARERSYQIEDPVYIRNYRPGQQKWIPAHVKSRYGRVLYDVLTEDGQLWRRHINQMRTRSQPSATDQAKKTVGKPSQYENPQEKYNEVHNEEVQPTRDPSNEIMDPNTTATVLGRMNRQRRPPDRLQVRPRKKTYM